MSESWRVRLTERAELDFVEIVQWTAENFGRRQAEHYAESLALAIEALTAGPDVLGAKARDDLGVGIRTLHIARHGRKARHFVVFRVADDHAVDVLRFLHDGMDLIRHLPADDDPLA